MTSAADLLAAMRGQTVQEDGVRRGVGHQLARDARTGGASRRCARGTALRPSRSRRRCRSRRAAHRAHRIGERARAAARALCPSRASCARNVSEGRCVGGEPKCTVAPHHHRRLGKRRRDVVARVADVGDAQTRELRRSARASVSTSASAWHGCAAAESAVDYRHASRPPQSAASGSCSCVRMTIAST